MAHARWYGPGLEHSHDLISRENKKTGTRHDHQAPSFLQFSLRQKLIHLWNIFTIEIDVAQSACDINSVSGIQVQLFTAVLLIKLHQESIQGVNCSLKR